MDKMTMRGNVEGELEYLANQCEGGVNEKLMEELMCAYEQAGWKRPSLRKLFCDTFHDMLADDDVATAYFAGYIRRIYEEN